MAKERELADLAAGQWGLLTTGQARSAGVTAQVIAKMARGGDLVRLAHGVYRLAGSPVDEHEELRAAWLGLDPVRSAEERLADPEVDVVSHRSAARMRGLGDLDADVMEFTVPRRRQTRRSDVRFHRAGVTARDWDLVGGLPVTTVLRTIDDLADQRIDRGHLADVVRDSLWRDGGIEDKLVRLLAAHARGYGSRPGDGRGLLQVMLREAGGPALQGAPAAELFRGVDPEVMRAIVPQLGADIVRSIAPYLDPQVIRAVVPRLETDLIRSILPQLDADIVRAIMPRLDAGVWQAILPDLNADVVRHIMTRPTAEPPAGTADARADRTADTEPDEETA
jgi:hypothetical protein